MADIARKCRVSQDEVWLAMKELSDMRCETCKSPAGGGHDNTPSAAPAASGGEAVAVDMGLPSGTLWCDRNVGAKSPEDYGAFFSWGNLVPYYPARDNMDWGNDLDCLGHNFNEEAYVRSEGFELEGNIDMAHDAACEFMGEPWQTPSAGQFSELFDNCDWVRKTVNGINGYQVTSRVNGNSIFLPASGSCFGTAWLYRGSACLYWSSSRQSARTALAMYFSSDYICPQDNYDRYLGLQVRPVQNVHQIISMTD